MKIGLLDIDGYYKFPNYALMKICAYEKSLGNFPEWINYFEHYDRVYISKIFSFSNNQTTAINSDCIIKGGTGFDHSTKLPQHIDDCEPDYSLYPKYKHSLGFLTRGCIRHCTWCVVPQKEGKIQPYRDIETILQDRKSAILMDNNVLAADYGLQQIEKIIDLGCKIDFNQGLDARLVTKEIAQMLTKVKWLDYIRFACDTSEMLPCIDTVAHRLKAYGFNHKNIFVYALINNDLKESYKRLKALKEIGITPFAQPFIDFSEKKKTPQWQLDLARWCNRKAIFKSVDFMDYQPRIGFKCKKYFE